MNGDNPLAQLIKNRCFELGLNDEGLGFRLGYKNPAKSAGRVQALCDGQITSPKSRFALSRLAAALQVSAETVDEARKLTEALQVEGQERDRQQQMAALKASEAVWRANFRPHVVILTKNARPSSIIMVGLSGGADRWLRIRLDTSMAPVTFVRQVLDILPSRLERVAGGDGLGVRFFGAVHGFAVNYGPDLAIRFNLNGEPVEVLKSAYRTGVTEIQVGGRKVSPDTVTTIIGGITK